MGLTGRVSTDLQPDAAGRDLTRTSAFSLNVDVPEMLSEQFCVSLMMNASLIITPEGLPLTYALLVDLTLALMIFHI